MSAKTDQFINDMAKAKLSNSAPRIGDGIYEPVVIKKFFTVEDGYNGDSAGVEFLVLASKPQPQRQFLRVGEDANVLPAPNAPLTTMGLAGPMKGKNKDITIGTFMQIFAAIFNWSKDFAESDQPEALAKRIEIMRQAFAGDGTAFAGYPLRAETYRAQTREKKEIHTRVRWSHYPFTEADVKLAREVLAKRGS